MPFVLFLALLASVTAAPTTKGRRANEQPKVKVRLVVTGETNVARTTRGARASNRVAQMAARGGNVTMSYSYPASYPSIMSVAATDSSDAKASFSQFNDEVDIAAPGVDVVSTVGATPVREGRSAAALPSLSRHHCLLPRPPERHWGRPPGL